jgi:hypothetical protein
VRIPTLRLLFSLIPLLPLVGYTLWQEEVTLTEIAAWVYCHTLRDCSIIYEHFDQLKTVR